MAVNIKIIWCVSWLVALTTTVKGYKSCDEAQNNRTNMSSHILLEIGGKQLQVTCNLTSQPAVTIIPVNDVVKIQDPGRHGSSQSFVHMVKYGGASLDTIRAFVEQSESCKQYVSYKCSNATLFGQKKQMLSSWTSIDDTTRDYWAGCSFSNRSCQCDQGKRMPEEDSGYLTKKKDLPVKSVQIGGLSSDSNVTVVIGDIECYGDNQKGALSLEDRNSFVLLNVSSMKEVKFKFRSLNSDKDKIIASLQLANNEEIKIGLNSDGNLYVGLMNYPKLDEEWHSIMLKVVSPSLFAFVDDGKKKPIFERPSLDTTGAKLVLGDPKRDCYSFIGCVKDLTVDSSTKMLTEIKMKEFVKDGCTKPQSIKCSPPKMGTDDESTTASSTLESTTKGGNTTGGGGGGGEDGGKKNNTNTDKDGDVGDGGDGGGGNDDAAIIAIVVVFLILLIILIVVFFITWYLKRNKGVYQTHEGSAENIHGDTDNLTLVTKPCDQETTEGDETKEYYL